MRTSTVEYVKMPTLKVHFKSHSSESWGSTEGPQGRAVVVEEGEGCWEGGRQGMNVNRRAPVFLLHLIQSSCALNLLFIWESTFDYLQQGLAS